MSGYKPDIASRNQIYITTHLKVKSKLCVSRGLLLAHSLESVWRFVHNRGAVGLRVKHNNIGGAMSPRAIRGIINLLGVEEGLQVLNLFTAPGNWDLGGRTIWEERFRSHDICTRCDQPVNLGRPSCSTVFSRSC